MATEPKALSSIYLFADGACSGNPGPGGWGAIILTPEGRVMELGGAVPNTTNNQMELTAIIRSLERLMELSIGYGNPLEGKRMAAEDIPIEIYTDSTYVIRGITQWIFNWRRNGWKTKDGEPVSNTELWKELSMRTQGLKLSWKYLRGHSGTPSNERVDEIAVAYSKGQRPDLYYGPLIRYPVALLDLPDSFDLPEPSDKSKVKAKAICYLSLVGGKLERHATWSECEARVKGRSGAKFKKATSEAEVQAILKEWGL